MPTVSLNWNLPQPVPRAVIQRYRGMHPTLAQILYRRGFDTLAKAETFLLTRQTNNPLAKDAPMKGVDVAVQRIGAAISRREPVVVYGDFDADGVTSTVLLVSVLAHLGADVEPYIPNRVDEGYGLNTPALQNLADEGKKLIITVDCGIRSVQEVEDGKAAGLDIIITDHHSIGPQIPDALAVINPKQTDCAYPEDMLAGVGVAYKLASALLQRRYAPDWQKAGEVLNDLLDLVALGTVADLAPLDREENRALVRRGLAVINERKRPGIRALLEAASAGDREVTAMDIGFVLGPRINAAGRLESAMLAYELLSTTDMQEAEAYAYKLNDLNRQRQDLTRDAQEKIREQVLGLDGDVPLIFASGEFQPGIVGLVAGRLVEEFYRPAIVMEEGEGESRASCRSIPQFDITAALDKCASLLVRHGGHAQAAGFTVLNDNIERLRLDLTALVAQGLDGQDLRPTLEIDAEVDIAQLDAKLLEELQKLEPTGHHNPAPVLASRGVTVREFRTVGADGQHLKLTIGRAGQPPLDAIAFRQGEWAETLADNPSVLVDLAYQLEMNEWNGKRTLQLNVQAIRPTGGA